MSEIPKKLRSILQIVHRFGKVIFRGRFATGNLSWQRSGVSTSGRYDGKTLRPCCSAKEVRERSKIPIGSWFGASIRFPNHPYFSYCTCIYIYIYYIGEHRYVLPKKWSYFRRDMVLTSSLVSSFGWRRPFKICWKFLIYFTRYLSLLMHLPSQGALPGCLVFM